jgi:hypothetical protein
VYSCRSFVRRAFTSVKRSALALHQCMYRRTITSPGQELGRVHPCSRQTWVLKWINRSPDGVSASHTLVSVYILCLNDWSTELLQRSLQPRDTRFQVFNLVFLVFARAIHVWQGCHCAPRLLYFETDVGRRDSNVLDLERPFYSKLRRGWCRSWRLSRRLEYALEELVEVGKDVKRRGRRERRGACSGRRR